MPRRKHTPEEIVAKLRQVDVLVRSASTGRHSARSGGAGKTSNA